MRILQQGKHPATLEYKTTCRKCKTVYAYKLSDGRVADDDRNAAAIVTKCPTCKNENWVDRNALTPVSQGE